MTKTKTSKTIAFIIAFAMVFTLFSFMGTAYANDTQEQIEVVNNSSLQAEIAACPAYYDKTITDVIPGTYSKVQLKITDYVPSEEEIKT